MERRLTTIIATDVVGYSRLVGNDEVGTIEALRSLRHDFIGPKERQYHGRTVKLMGDGALMEFASVVDAVAFAVELQMGLQARNAALPDDRQIVFRIGVNIGDIIVDGDDIYGDGVNMAARLETLCEPGGILLSGNAFNQVGNRLDLRFESLGEREVKNIREPVTVYRVLLDDKAATLVTPVSPPVPPRRRRSIALAAGVAAGLAFLAALAGWQAWPPGEELARIDRMAFALPDKPSIVVLPFDNLSDDPAQEYFVDGLTEDLITDLSQISSLFVIARNSSFYYKNRQVTIAQVAEDLGVRYVLEGSVRRVADQIRVNAQLIDATTSGHIWAERFDRRFDNIFAAQDAILAQIVEALEVRLTDKEKVRQDNPHGTASLEAYELMLRARRQLTQFDRKAADQARELLEKSIEIDPRFAQAYGLLGFYHFDEWRVWGNAHGESLARAEELAAKAAELSPTDPVPHALLAMVHQWRREFDDAGNEIDKALAREPREAITLSNIGSVLTYADRGAEARDALLRAIRLDPFHPPNYLEWLGNAHWLVGEYENCIDVAERGVALNPDYVSLHVVLAVCHASLGDKAHAQKAAAEILRINPRFTLAAYAGYVPYANPQTLERRIRLLRAAGVPD